MKGPDPQGELAKGRKRQPFGRRTGHLDLDGGGDRRAGTGAVRDRVRARVAEARVRRAGERPGRRREAHPRRQLTPGTRKGVGVRLHPAHRRRQQFAVKGSDPQSELAKGRKRQRLGRRTGHLDLDGGGDRRAGTGAVRDRVRARVVEACVRRAGERPGRRREAHPRRQLTPGTVEGVGVRLQPARRRRQQSAVKGSDPQGELAKGRKREWTCESRTDGEMKRVGNTSRRPKSGVGFGDRVCAVEGLVPFRDRSGAGQDRLIGKQGHPVRTTLDARLIGRDPSGYPEWEPMFNRLPGRKVELERVLPFPSRPLDGKMAAAAGSEQEGKANRGDRFDALQGGSHGRSRFVPFAAGPGGVRSRLPDVIVPFDAALHAAAIGGACARSAGTAFRGALNDVAERAIEGPAPTTNP